MRFGFAIILFLTCAVARAGQPLSFDDCVSEASANNRDLLTQTSTVKSLEYQVNGAYSGFYPQLSTTIDFDYGQSSINGNLTSNFSNQGALFSIAPSVSMTQNIFSGFADVAKVDLARANLEAARADLKATKAKVSSDLKNAFAGLVYAQDFQKLANDIKDRRSANYKLVSLLFESGRENFGSVALAKAYLDQADFQIFQATNGLRAASVELARTLGRDLVTDLRVVGNVPLVDAEASPDFSTLALKVPNYVKAIAQEKAAVAQKVSAFSPFYPSISLISSAGLNANSNTSTTQWLVGLSLSYPFFSGGKDYYATKSAGQAITTAQLSKLAIQSSDLSGLVSAHRAYIEAKQQLRVDQSFTDALSKQEKIATADYNNGFLSFQNWDLIETSYITRQFTVLTDVKGLVSAEAAWQLSQGIGVIP